MVLNSSLQKTQTVDFSWNQLADPKFVFHDPGLVELVREGDLAAQHFFRLLALCHTVMPEEKTEGERRTPPLVLLPGGRGGPERTAVSISISIVYTVCCGLICCVDH